MHYTTDEDYPAADLMDLEMQPQITLMNTDKGLLDASVLFLGPILVSRSYEQIG